MKAVLSEWVKGVLHHFQQILSHVVKVFACDRYYGCYHIVLPHLRTMPQTSWTQIPHLVTLSWHQANQSLFYPLNAMHQAKKHLFPILPSLVCRDWEAIARSSAYKDDALTTGPPQRSSSSDLYCIFFGSMIYWMSQNKMVHWPFHKNSNIMAITKECYYNIKILYYFTQKCKQW